MAKWILKLITVGFVMTLILRMLPDNSVKRAVQMAFGIIFLLVTVMPIGKLFSSGFTGYTISRYFENELASIQNGEYDTDYVDDVIDTYCANIENSMEKLIFEETGSECDILVNVYDDVKSDDFGKLISVSCNIKSKNDSYSQSDISDTKENNSIVSDVPLVNDIVISLEGIYFDDDKTDANVVDSTLKNKILTILYESFGVSSDICTFRE